MSQESQQSEAEFSEAEEGSNVGDEDGESRQSPQSESPYDDSDGDVDYNPAKDDDAGDDSDSDKDEELEDLLSNPNIPEQQRKLMKKYIQERIELDRRDRQKEGVKSKYAAQKDKPKDKDISQHIDNVVPSQKRKSNIVTSSPADSVPAKVPKYSGASLLEDSNSSINVEGDAKDIHSPSLLPNVSTKRRILTPTHKKGSSASSKSSKPTPLQSKQNPSTLAGLSGKSRRSTSKQSFMRAKNLSTPSRSDTSGKSKGKKIVYRTPSTPKEGSRPSQSNISDTTTPKHADAPAYVSSKYKAVWLPYEGDSEDEYEDGVKKKKNWSEEEKETLYRIANHFK